MREKCGWNAYYQWTKLCEEVGVKCEIHWLRHTAATELVNSGLGVGTVRQLLGHRNLQTTQRYAKLSGRVGYNAADYLPTDSRPIPNPR